MDAAARKEVIERYVDAYNAFDVEAMMALMHDDVAFFNVSGGTVDAQASGKAELCALAEHAKQLFASREQRITAYEDDGDGVTIEVAFDGVLAADLPNGMKAGQVLHLDGRSTFAFREGKIYRLTDYS